MRSKIGVSGEGFADTRRQDRPTSSSVRAVKAEKAAALAEAMFGTEPPSWSLVLSRLQGAGRIGVGDRRSLLGLAFCAGWYSPMGHMPSTDS